MYEGIQKTISLIYPFISINPYAFLYVLFTYFNNIYRARAQVF